MNKVEVDNEKNEVRIYHRFKVGDKIYINTKSRENQSPQTIYKVIAFIKSPPLITYQVIGYNYCMEKMVEFYDDSDDTKKLYLAIIKDLEFKIGNKVKIKSSYFKDVHTITDIEIQIGERGYDIYYYIDGDEDKNYSDAYYTGSQLDLIN